jgi:hypothetical protein
MEIKGATLLYTLAGLMITFAGFSALLLFIRPAAISPKEFGQIIPKVSVTPVTLRIIWHNSLRGIWHNYDVPSSHLHLFPATATRLRTVKDFAGGALNEKAESRK